MPYQNERGVGAVNKESGPCLDHFQAHKGIRRGKTMAGIDKMLSAWGTDYIDLLLPHQQFGDIPAHGATWKSRGGGESAEHRTLPILSRNVWKKCFLHLKSSQASAPGGVPSLLPADGAEEARRSLTAPPSSAGIPSGHGDPQGLIGEPVFLRNLGKIRKSNVQIILRWHIQKAISSSRNPRIRKHIRANFDIFDLR